VSATLIVAQLHARPDRNDPSDPLRASIAVVRERLAVVHLLRWHNNSS
jgi:hypothetical protein